MTKEQTTFGQRAQAKSIIARFAALGYEVLWGGGDTSKGHGYWIRGIKRRPLLRGHFNRGNSNPHFQMHGEAKKLLRQLEAKAAA